MYMVGIILEHIIGQEKLIISTNQADLDKVNNFWQKDDKTLKNLNNKKLISTTRWCDLSIKDFEFFIISAVEKFFSLPKALKNNNAKEVEDIRFLIQCMAKYYKEKLDLNLESIKIYLHNDTDISFDFKLGNFVKLQNSVNKPVLKIAIDNTKK